MATAEPAFDLFSPYFRALVEEYDGIAFPNGVPEDLDRKIGGAYNDFFKRPYVCSLMADVNSGRWKLGESQETIAARLGGADRTWVSHSLRRGRLTMDLYVRLRCCPTRPEDWEPDVDELQGEMCRSAFIGVCRLLARNIRNRPLLVPETLDELNYELICELVAYWEIWLPLRVRGTATNKARQIVGNVCADRNRNVNPEWYVGDKRKQIESRMARLQEDAAKACEYLTRLEQNWMIVIAKAIDSLAQVKWTDQ